MFAKLFGTDDNQILVMIQEDNDENPEVRVFFQPDGLGICTVAFSWKDDSDKSWDEAEETFNKMEAEGAQKIVDSVLRNLDQECEE